MREFEYAQPLVEEEVVGLLAPPRGSAEVLAGGTDLIGLMKEMIVAPARLVDITSVESLRGIQADSQGLRLGAVTSLEDLFDAPALDAYPAVKQAIAGISSIQWRSQGTLGGELCQRPRCWYFRNGHGLLADGGRMVEQGDNRFHAILGNTGPAKFVSPSRLAPALLAYDAQARLLGPQPDEETRLPLEFFYRIPRSDHQRENVLKSGQFLTHVFLPPAPGAVSATYEVRQGAGPDDPLASAAVVLHLDRGYVVQAKVVLGQVAPIPWVSAEAAEALVGQRVSQATAHRAAEAALAGATPLSKNAYKVQLAQVAVERAVLRAAGLATGGF